MGKAKAVPIKSNGKRQTKEDAMCASWCHNNGIFIYPLPFTNYGAYKIAVNRKGEVKVGELIFKDEPLPGEFHVWDKIRELYKDIYTKNNKAV